MKQPNKDKKIKVSSEDNDFITNWYKTRKTILGNDGKPTNLPKIPLNFNPEIIEQNFSNSGTLGEYNPATKQIGVSPNYKNIPGILSHETNHFVLDQYKRPDFRNIVAAPIEKIINEDTENKVKDLGDYGNYLLDPDEVHSRLMQFRQNNKFKPDEIIDAKRLKDSNNRELFKLDMFDDNQMLDLLNKTVQLDNTESSKVQTAKYGGTINSKKMRKNKKTNLPKYEFGTYVDNPSTDLAQNQINLEKAKLKASKNPWVQGLDIFGNLAMQVGTSMMNKGMSNGEGADGKGVAGFLAGNSGTIQSGLNTSQTFANSGGFAFGGNVPGSKVEVEGEEVGQTPNGDVMQFSGPSHEAGGIPIALPEGTEIYSKRIKVDGVSMADRKKKRESKSLSLESLLEKNHTDTLLKNSLSRTKQNNELEEVNDNKIQQLVKMLMEGNGDAEQHAYGTPVGPGKRNNEFSTDIDGFSPYNPNVDMAYRVNEDMQTIGGSPMSTAPLDFNAIKADGKKGSGSTLDDLIGGVTAGDAMGIFGNLYQAFAPARETQKNRAGDTPNINAFKDYGKDGLDVLDESKGYVNQVRDAKLKDLELSRNAAIKSSRNGARGINTSRALNLATDANINNAKSDTYSQFAQEMLGILGQEAGMKNQQDQVVMGGEQGRDLADRQDRDNFFTQTAADKAAIGEGLSKTGGNLNDIKQRKVIENLINQLSAYGITVNSSGKLSNKKK